MRDSDRTPPMYPRGIQPRVLDALADTPVVLISGPRQAGKTTLARQERAQTQAREAAERQTVFDALVKEKAAGSSTQRRSYDATCSRIA